MSLLTNTIDREFPPALGRLRPGLRPAHLVRHARSTPPASGPTPAPRSPDRSVESPVPATGPRGDRRARDVGHVDVRHARTGARDESDGIRPGQFTQVTSHPDDEADVNESRYA